MQLLPALTSDPKTVAREAPAGGHLPYARHLNDATIQTRDGLLMQTIRVRGLLFGLRNFKRFGGHGPQLDIRRFFRADFE